MTVISKHTGQNIGGISLIEFAFPYEISAFEIFPGYIAKVTIPKPNAWKTLYATPHSFSGGGSSENTPAGTLYTYDFKFRCPKDRPDLIEAFHRIQTTGAIFRITDANAQKRIYGTRDNPMVSKSKLLLPGEVQGYNGYEISLSVSTADPALLDPSQ
ncbi:MAG TPA: hypothetical protein PKM34_01335 [Bacteroidales bacterium]|nr:hypothetical protein [Bacteroidales bacterium]